MYMTLLDLNSGTRKIINLNAVVIIENKNTALELRMANQEVIKIDKADGDKIYDKIGARL